MTDEAKTTDYALVAPSGSLLVRSIGAPAWYAAMLGEAARPRLSVEQVMAQGFRVVRVRVEVLTDEAKTTAF